MYFIFGVKHTDDVEQENYYMKLEAEDQMLVYLFLIIYIFNA